MRTVLLDVHEETVKIIEVDGSLDSYYTNLRCRCIDIVERKIGGRWFDVVCDDEGLFAESPKISAINDMGEPMFVGNLMFFHNDGEGDLVGLSDEDIRHLQGCIEMMYTQRFMGGYPMLTQCEYN